MKKIFFYILPVTVFIVLISNVATRAAASNQDPIAELMALVNDAAGLVEQKGEAAFRQFRLPGSRWYTEDTYIFVIDPQGTVLVHDDKSLVDKNMLNLKDINGKPIIRGFISAVTSSPHKREGWYHYQFPEPGGLLPRWKSSYVKLVFAPSGKPYIIGSGIYDDQMQKEFVVDMVKDAIIQIEKHATIAFHLFYDPTTSFLVKDAYIFVIDSSGVELVNPAFPNLEGRNIMEVKDAEGKYLVKEMFEVVRTQSSGWVNYMWPKPGENISTRKSTYVSKAYMGNRWVLVGCGVYLSDAPKAEESITKMTAPQLMGLVNEAALVFQRAGEAAYPEFRIPGSKWFEDDTYFFVWSMDGTRMFHAANPTGEGINMRNAKDALGRPWGSMFLEVASSPKGEGWVHYMYPEPGDIFPTWKSTFIKRVMFPSGDEYLIGCGIYNMQMDRSFITDLVDRAADLIAEHGKYAFPHFRDKTGAFLFMDTYIFVDDVTGIELVNGGQPSMEGKNFLDLKDINGKMAAREYIETALQNGSGWVDYYWYKPGENKPSHKYTYVKKVVFGKEIYIVGAGLYAEDNL